MELTIEKGELEGYLLTIIIVDSKENKVIGGLLQENLTLGAKRRLQKIHKKLADSYKELVEDAKEIEKECGEDTEKKNKEFEILSKEKITLEIEPVDLAQIEGISTTNNYNFDFIEKIAQ